MAEQYSFFMERRVRNQEDKGYSPITEMGLQCLLERDVIGTVSDWDCVGLGLCRIGSVSDWLCAGCSVAAHFRC